MFLFWHYGKYTKLQLGNFVKKPLQWEVLIFLWPKSCIIGLLRLLLWSSNFNVSLVWFFNLFRAIVLISSLLKEQQIAISEFSWKTLAEESTDLFAKQKLYNWTIVDTGFDFLESVMFFSMTLSYFSFWILNFEFWGQIFGNFRKKIWRRRSPVLVLKKLYNRATVDT